MEQNTERFTPKLSKYMERNESSAFLKHTRTEHPVSHLLDKTQLRLGGELCQEHRVKIDQTKSLLEEFA